MARRRQRKRPAQTGVQLVQIISLGVILVVILLFRDKFSVSAGAMMDALGSTSEDVNVPKEPIAVDQPVKEDSESANDLLQ